MSAKRPVLTGDDLAMLTHRNTVRRFALPIQLQIETAVEREDENEARRWLGVRQALADFAQLSLPSASRPSDEAVASLAAPDVLSLFQQAAQLEHDLAFAQGDLEAAGGWLDIRGALTRFSALRRLASTEEGRA